MLSFLFIDNKDEFASDFLNVLLDLFPGCNIRKSTGYEEIKNGFDGPDLIMISASLGYFYVKDMVDRFKSGKNTASIPVLLLTDGRADFPLSGDETELRIDGVVTWPSKPLGLKTMINSMIRMGKAESRLQEEEPCPEQYAGKSKKDLCKFIERHEGIFENTGNAIAIYRAVEDGNDFVFVEINRAVERIENVKREDLIGKKLTEVYPGVRELGLFKVIGRVWKTGIPERHPVSLYKGSHITSWRENHVYRLPSDEVVTIYTDETKHKIAEMALVESEERFRQLAENIQEVFWVVSPDWKQVHYISPAYESVWGLSCESLYKNPLSWADPIIAEDKETVLNYLKEKIEGNLSEIIFPEFRIVHTDWSIRWISARGYPVLNEKGRPYRIVGVSEDITEKKQSEKAFNTILEGTAWAIGQDFFDKIVKELSAWLDCEIAMIGKIVNGSTVESVSAIRDGKLLRDFSYPVEGTPCKNVIRDGYAYHPFDLQEIFPEAGHIQDMSITGFVGIRLLDMEGEAIGVLAALSKERLLLPERAEDVMKILAARISAEIERHTIEEKKKQIEVLLQQAQKMESIGTLAGGIAHDFNNILQSIILNTELAQFENSGNTVVQHRMDEVLRASKRATDLVKQILTFSRQSELELKPLKISLVIKEALKMLRSSLPTTIEIITNICKEDDLVLADPTQIHQVVMNLCTNASHAMRENGGSLTVNLEPVEIRKESIGIYPELNPGYYLRLSVSDTGHGMEKNTIDRIFDPFFTTKERGEGTGLGLAVVYGIIKELKGAIRVESERDSGTSFSILFPRIQRPVKADAVETRPIPGGTEVMLLIDDEEGLLVAQRKIFERLGYRVETRSSSIEALEAFKANPGQYDIVITDQTMPKMTGAQLAKEFIAIRPDIPIILCTGFSDVISEEEAKSIGIKEFIMKPIVISEIAWKVREILS